MRVIRNCFIVIVLLVIVDIACRFLFVSPASGFSINERFDRSEWFEPQTYAQLKPHLDVTVKDKTRIGSYRVQTNTYGMRMDEIAVKKGDGKTRIAVLGDSVAFGLDLEREQTFPSYLQQLLDQEKPNQYEVLNFATPDYSSFQILKQYERLTHNFSPDIVIIAAGLYDSKFTMVSDKEYYTLLETYNLTQPPSGISQWLSRFSTAGNWWNQHQRHAAFQEMSDKLTLLNHENHWKRRVDLEDYSNYLKAIINHHQSQGGKTILVHSNLQNFYAYQNLKKLSRELNASLLDVREITDYVGGVEERKKRFALRLEPSGYIPGSAGALIRCYFPTAIQPEKPMAIVEYTTNTSEAPVALYDDGTHGDENAHDRVWSASIDRSEFDVGYALVLNEPIMPERKHLQYFRIPAEQFVEGQTYIEDIVIYGKVPFEDLTIPGHPEWPNSKLHASIAERLEAMVETAVASGK